MMSQEKPRPQGLDLEGVCIGVPFAHGVYPASPPPLTSARSGGATPLASESSVDQRSRCRENVETNLCLALAVLFLVGVFALTSMDDKYPSFKVEWVLVSVDDNVKSGDSQVTAEWNIGFAVKNSNSHASFDYQDFDVSVLCMFQGWSGTVVRPFSQDPGNTTLLNATVNTLLPRYDLLPRLIQGLNLEFKVMLRADYGKYTVKAMCKDMTVGFSLNSTKGIMMGGPRLCPLDSHSCNNC